MCRSPHKLSQRSFLPPPPLAEASMSDGSECGEIRDAAMTGVCTPQTHKLTFVAVDRWIDGNGVCPHKEGGYNLWYIRSTDPGVQTSISDSEAGVHSQERVDRDR